MKMNRWGLFVALVALSQAPAAVAQLAVPAAKSPVTPTAMLRAASAQTGERMTAAKDPAGEGIQVHGHWILQVKNADGTLGERREFENSLVTDDQAVSGNQLLYLLLSGNGAAGDPVVIFGVNTIPSGGASQECSGPQFAVPTIHCYGITTSKSPVLGTTGLSYSPLCFSGIQTGLSVTTNVTSTVNIVLAGNFTVPSGVTSFTFVQTAWPVCTGASIPQAAWLSQSNGAEGERFSGDPSANRGGTIAPSACNNTVNFTSNQLIVGPMTSTNIPSGPLVVTPGQTIQVTVTISFS
jgi:hypothetical protein